MREITNKNVYTVSSKKLYAFLDRNERTSSKFIQLVIEDADYNRWILTGGRYVNLEAFTLILLLRKICALHDYTLFEFDSMKKFRKWVKTVL